MRRFLSVIVLLFMSLALFADGVTFTGKAPAKVGVGQRMQVQYTLNERPSSIQLGNIPGFKLVGGPSQSSSSSISIVNGVTTSSNSYTYTYTLEAVSEGSYTLGGAVAVVNGTKYTSNTISVTVQKDAVQQQRQRPSNYYYDPFEDLEEFFGGGQSRSQQWQQPQQKVEIAGDDVLLRIHSTKTNLVKGEAALVTIKLYTAIDLTSIEDFTPPKFNDFYVEELDVNTTLEWTTETINGKKYNAAVLKKYLVFPRRAGKVEIDESNISCNARVITGRSYWGYVCDSKPVAAKAPSVTLNVSELPSEPEGFSGAVGKFNISMNMPSDSVSVNEAVVCKITISGTGNFNNIESPKMLDSKEIESYEPVVNTNLKASESGLSGSKTWEYTLVPRYGGTYNLGSISLVYYDVATKRYNTVSTDSIIINVRNGGNASNTIYNSQTGVEVINPEDVRYIHKGDLKLAYAYLPFIQTGLYWYIIIGLLIAFIILVVLLRKNIKKRQNVGLMKQQKANKISRKRLKTARKYMKANDPSGFYKEVISALWGYASDKMMIPTAQLTKDNVMQAFAEHNISEEISRQFVELVDKCEFAHFVSNSGNEMHAIYAESTKIIEQLEENIR